VRADIPQSHEPSCGDAEGVKIVAMQPLSTWLMQENALTYLKSALTRRYASVSHGGRGDLCMFDDHLPSPSGRGVGVRAQQPSIMLRV
jgi:hypothetical protein